MVLGFTVNVRRQLDRSALPFTASTKLGVDIADVRDLQEALEQYAADKAIARPVARQLGAALDAAVRHADRGREVQAARQLGTFVDRLRKTPAENSISDEAKQRLRRGAANALRVLSDA